MAFHLGDFAEAITLFGFGDLLFRFCQQGSLIARDAQVVDGDRHRRLGGVVEAQVLELIGHGCRGRRAVVLVGPGHEIAQGLLIDHPVAEGGCLLAQRAIALLGLGFSFGSSQFCSGLFGNLFGFLGWGGGHGCARVKNGRKRKKGSA